jgi:hypothetical protein
MLPSASHGVSAVAGKSDFTALMPQCSMQGGTHHRLVVNDKQLDRECGRPTTGVGVAV